MYGSAFLIINAIPSVLYLPRTTVYIALCIKNQQKIHDIHCKNRKQCAIIGIT